MVNVSSQELDRLSPEVAEQRSDGGGLSERQQLKLTEESLRPPAPGEAQQQLQPREHTALPDRPLPEAEELGKNGMRRGLRERTPNQQ
eukprot:15352206-Alexandrium_andersonii.AAC.1